MSRMLGTIGLAAFVLGVYLMGRCSPADDGRVFAVLLVVGGPMLLVLSKWFFQIDRQNKLDK